MTSELEKSKLKRWESRKCYHIAKMDITQSYGVIYHHKLSHEPRRHFERRTESVETKIHIQYQDILNLGKVCFEAGNSQFMNVPIWTNFVIQYVSIWHPDNPRICLSAPKTNNWALRLSAVFIQSIDYYSQCLCIRRHEVYPVLNWYTFTLLCFDLVWIYNRLPYVIHIMIMILLFYLDTDS